MFMVLYHSVVSTSIPIIAVIVVTAIVGVVVSYTPKD
jgi:hypothetical protein